MIDLARAAGKYGAYIWPAYGVSLAGLIAMFVDTVVRARRWRREFNRLRDEPPSTAPNEREKSR